MGSEHPKRNPFLFQRQVFYLLSCSMTVGIKRDFIRAGDDSWSYVETPLQFQAIDTDNLTEIARLDLPVSHMHLSPDGRWLLMSGTQQTEITENAWQTRGSGLFVYDTRQMEQKAHLQSGFESWVRGFSPDSRYAYMNSRGEDERYLQVLDLHTQDIVAQRYVESFGSLISNPNRPISSTVSTAVEEASSSMEFTLLQNYPNPFNSNTTIGFALSETKPGIELKIYNLMGQSIRTLTAGSLARGWHQVSWDGKDGRGRELSSGLYFFRLESGSQVETRKLLLLR